MPQRTMFKRTTDGMHVPSGVTLERDGDFVIATIDNSNHTIHNRLIRIGFRDGHPPARPFSAPPSRSVPPKAEAMGVVDSWRTMSRDELIELSPKMHQTILRKLKVSRRRELKTADDRVNAIISALTK